MLFFIFFYCTIQEQKKKEENDRITCKKKCKKTDPAKARPAERTIYSMNAGFFSFGKAAFDFWSDARPTPFWSGVKVRKARKIKNNTARWNFNQSYSITLLPVISGGTPIPSSFNTVGATSCREPSFT